MNTETVNTIKSYLPVITVISKNKTLYPDDKIVSDKAYTSFSEAKRELDALSAHAKKFFSGVEDVKEDIYTIEVVISLVL